jgi:hypothetical protein
MSSSRDLKKLYYEIFGEELQSSIAKVEIKGDVNDIKIQRMADVIFRGDRQYVLCAEQIDDYAVFTGIEWLNTNRKKEYITMKKGENVLIYYFYEY